MPRRVKQLLIAVGSVAGSVTIWFAGWFFYTYNAIYEEIVNVDYQNGLIAIIGAVGVIAILAISKTRTPLTNLDKKTINNLFNEASQKLGAEVDALKNTFEKTQTDLADLKISLKTKPDNVTPLETKLNIFEATLKQHSTQITTLETEQKILCAKIPTTPEAPTK